MSKRIPAAARHTIIRADDPGAGIYVLRSGWAARIRYLPDGQAQYCAILLPTDPIGLTSLPFARPTEDVVALTACELDGVDASDLWRAAAASPDLDAWLIWALCNEARRLGNWLTAIGRGNAEQRIALLLLETRARLILAKVIDSDCSDFAFPLTQQVIGDLLGLTSVHVNRVLKKLRETGLARVAQARAEIALPGLARLAAPLLDVHERRAPEFGLTRAAAA